MKLVLNSNCQETKVQEQIFPNIIIVTRTNYTVVAEERISQSVNAKSLKEPNCQQRRCVG